jgi:hypothetical protein
MKQFEITMVVQVPDRVDEQTLTGSIVDDAIRAYTDIVEIAYECTLVVSE